MSSVVRSRIPLSYSSSSKYSSQVLARGHQPEMLRSPSPRRRNRAKASAPVRRNSQAPSRQRGNKYQATGDSSHPEMPTWLRFLIAIQRGSIPITFLLVVGVLTIYGWSVYSQRAWSRSYRQLAQLQREERQLTAASEARKYQLAQEAENSTTGLVRRDPANVIFLKPEPSRSPGSSSTQPTKGPVPVFPIGY